MRIFVFSILVFLFSQTVFATITAGDTLPPSISNQISRDLSFLLQRREDAANLAFFYTRSQFNQNQIDSLLLAFNNDSIVNISLALIMGQWHLNSEHIHRRLCSFINLDTMDYNGRWGENRRLYTRGKELGARLALAKLGYAYHIDYLESIFREQDISNHRMAWLLTSYTRYVTNDQILNALFDLALTGQNYRYMDYDLIEFTQYHFLSYVLFTLYKSLSIRETLLKKEELGEYTWEDYQILSKWVVENRYKEGLLTEHRYGMSLKGDGGLTFLSPLQTPREMSGEDADKKAVPIPSFSDRPHLRHQGVCYFDGDAIQVKRPDSGNKVRLMAYRDARQLMGSALEWEGVDEVEPYHYGVLSADTLKDTAVGRKVKAICRGCGKNDADITVEVAIEMQE